MTIVFKGLETEEGDQIILIPVVEPGFWARLKAWLEWFTWELTKALAWFVVGVLVANL